MALAVGDRSADGAAVADLVVADLAGGLGQQTTLALDVVVDLNIAVAGQRANSQMIARVTDVLEVVQAADIDQVGGRCKAKPHERDQRVATGKQFGLVAVFGERGDCLVGRTGSDVVERSGNHLAAPEACSTALTMLW